MTGLNKSKDNSWRDANIVLLLVAIVTVYSGTASIATGVGSPVFILPGVIMLIACVFSAKHNIWALGFGTGLVAIDVLASLFALSITALSPIIFIAKLLMLLLLFKSFLKLYEPQHKSRMRKGLIVGMLAYMLLMPLVMTSLGTQAKIARGEITLLHTEEWGGMDIQKQEADYHYAAEDRFIQNYYLEHGVDLRNPSGGAGGNNSTTDGMAYDENNTVDGNDTAGSEEYE